MMLSIPKTIVGGALLMLLGFALVVEADGSGQVFVRLPSPENTAVMAVRARPGSSTLTKTMAWVSGIKPQMQKAIRGFRSVKLAGDINEQLGYVEVNAAREGREDLTEDHLFVLNKKTGVVLFSTELVARVEGDQVWPNQMGGFSFRVSPTEQLWATVISAAHEIGNAHYEEGLGYMRVILCDKGSVLWVSPVIPTCRLSVAISARIFDFCVLARPLAGDVDGDGYRDLILWRREYAPSNPGRLFPWSLKKQDAIVYRYLPQEKGYSSEPSTVGLVLDDSLWYPGGWGEAKSGGREGAYSAWAGCDDSSVGFSYSRVYRDFVSKDEARTLFRWAPASASSTVSIPIVPLADGNTRASQGGVEESRESPEGAQERPCPPQKLHPRDRTSHDLGFPS